MAQTNWNKIATKEFKQMDRETQAEWSDLRSRVS